mgnify:CR=1 FL=1
MTIQNPAVSAKEKARERIEAVIRMCGNARDNLRDGNVSAEGTLTAVTGGLGSIKFVAGQALAALSATEGEAWFCGGCGQTDPSKRCLGCLHDMRASPPSAPAGVKVKPLFWREPDKRSNGCWTADCILGTFSVGFDDGWHASLEDSHWEWEPENDPRSYEGPSAAQAACQALLDFRIRSSLQPDTQAAAASAPAQEGRADE